MCWRWSRHIGCITVLESRCFLLLLPCVWVSECLSASFLARLLHLALGAPHPNPSYAIASHRIALMTTQRPIDQAQKPQTKNADPLCQRPALLRSPAQHFAHADRLRKISAISSSICIVHLHLCICISYSKADWVTKLSRPVVQTLPPTGPFDQMPNISNNILVRFLLG